MQLPEPDRLHPTVAYGARPVSVDLARVARLTESRVPSSLTAAYTLPLTAQVVADRLALAHWPAGHQIAVCALAGGTGRTVTAGLLATVLAELPYAHVWPPVALVDAAPRGLPSTVARWGVVGDSSVDDALPTPAGAWAFTSAASRPNPRDFSVVVVDESAGLPDTLPSLCRQPSSSVVLLTRPDRASLAEVADALVAMSDASTLSRHQVVVLVNRGVGSLERGSRAAIAALSARCQSVYSLPFATVLGAGRPVPHGAQVPRPIRQLITRVLYDLWRSRTTPPRPMSSLKETS